MTEPREGACPFCPPNPSRVFLETDLIVGVWDGFPVSDGHALLVPRRHVPTWFEASGEERQALTAAIADARAAIQEKYQPDGYNIGFNAGEAAGQTVPHLHIHVIPRYAGDVPDPTGGVRHVIPELANYLDVQPAPLALRKHPHDRALVTGSVDPLLPHLLTDLDDAHSVDIVAAFVMRSGVEQIYDYLVDLLDRNGRLRLVTGDYMGLTDPDALTRLLDLEGDVALRVFGSTEQSFHPKAYILKRQRDAVAYVGSSNLSKSALLSGIEWNYRVIHSHDRAGFGAVTRAFDELFGHPSTQALTNDWIKAYRARRQHTPVPAVELAMEPPPPPAKPHGIQVEALKALETTRLEGNKAGLVVLATGLGKTWLSAFDSLSYGRVLFVAHREEILKQARATYRKIRPQASLGFYNGQEKAPDSDVLFASIQTLGRVGHLRQFARNAFDYIVVDEFHHAAAGTYQKLLNHFTPEFLLGLTATPERTDGRDLLSLCGENLVYRCDLFRGIELGLLSPFNYMGVPDNVDYANIPWRSSQFDPEALSNALATEARAQNALEQYRLHGGQRTLAFCCSQGHANYMRDYFQEHALRAAAVHSGEGSAPRATALEKLSDGDIDILFAVDMFNEGVDVPEIDTVLMLRPTESTILWVQQFGRGLRTAEGKERLNVIDYIGNHKVFLNKPRALLQLDRGTETLRDALARVEAGSLDLPPGCSVIYDLEAIEILRAMLPASQVSEALAEYYTDFEAQHGIRPRAVEAFHDGYRPRSKGVPSWFDFVRARNGLTAPQARLSPQAAEFLRHLETTPMTRSYKMLLIISMLNLDALPGEAKIEDVIEEFSRVAGRTSALQKDVGVPISDTNKLTELVVTNPIRAFAEGRGTGGTSYFAYEGEMLKSNIDIPTEQREGFQELAREIADWRLAQYVTRLGLTETDGAFQGQVSHAGGRPIIFLPDRLKVPGIPLGQAQLLIGDEVYQGDFAKVALNVVRRSSEEPNQLPSILRGWFGADSGKPGTHFRVQFDPTDDGYTMKPVGQPAGGKELTLWQQYAREEIPGLFGLTFSPGGWNQGFISQGQDLFLLVTLEKKDMDHHQYRDHFLSPAEFQWQSQRQTKQESGQGKKIGDHKKLGITVHLFVRSSKKISSKAAPFTYCGDVSFKRWEGNQPITVWWTLKEPVPERLHSRLKVPS